MVMDDKKGHSAGHANPRLVLASASPRRIELLARLGIPFTVDACHQAEIDQPDLTSRELAMLNATIKACVVAQHWPGITVLGADTVVSLEGRSIGKPKDLNHARHILRSLSGKTHQVITGVCLYLASGRKVTVFADETLVQFKPLTDETIEWYVRNVNVLDKAGGYAIQEHGERLVQGISGSWYNVVGLPLERLAEELEEWFELPKGLLCHQIRCQNATLCMQDSS